MLFGCIYASVHLENYVCTIHTSGLWSYSPTVIHKNSRWCLSVVWLFLNSCFMMSVWWLVVSDSWARRSIDWRSGEDWGFAFDRSLVWTRSTSTDVYQLLRRLNVNHLTFVSKKYFSITAIVHLFQNQYHLLKPESVWKVWVKFDGHPRLSLWPTTNTELQKSHWKHQVWKPSMFSPLCSVSVFICRRDWS